MTLLAVLSGLSTTILKGLNATLTMFLAPRSIHGPQTRSPAGVPEIDGDGVARDAGAEKRAWDPGGIITAERLQHWPAGDAECAQACKIALGKRLAYRHQDQNAAA